MILSRAIAQPTVAGSHQQPSILVPPAIMIVRPRLCASRPRVVTDRLLVGGGVLFGLLVGRLELLRLLLGLELLDSLRALDRLLLLHALLGLLFGLLVGRLELL